MQSNLVCIRTARPRGRAVIAALALFAIVCAPARCQQAAKNTTTRQAATPGDPRLQPAQALLEQGRTDEARQKVEEYLQENSKSVEGYNLLGIIFTGEKDNEKALAAFQRALALNPHSIKTRNNVGNTYVALGRLELAERQFRTSLQIDPANSDAHFNLGLVLLSRERPAEAIPHFLLVKPASLESQFNLTRAYLRSGLTAQGLKSAAGLSAEHPNDVQVHFTLGVILGGEKQYRQAELELEKANSLQPETFEILFNLGQVLLHSGNYSKAELVLRRAQTLQPDSPEALYLLAQVYSDQSRPVDALELLVRAHTLSPENTDIIFLLARVSMTQNYFEDAIPLLETGIKLAPRRADLRAALGESLFMSGKADRAIEEFKQLVQIDPTARSYAFLGLSYRHLGRFEEAQKYFAAGLKLDPQSASCLFNLGYIAGRQGNQAEAEEYFQRALRANPDFSDALLELANLRINDRKFSEAAELLRRFTKVSRDPATGYYKLAMVERNLKQFDAAQRDLSVFQTLSKNTSPGPYPYQHLFDYLDNRAMLSEQQRAQLDLTELAEQIKKHPDRPQDLYLFAEANLKLGKLDDARAAVAQLDQISADDFRMQAGLGVLLARYRRYDEAIRHFQAAAKANPDSDDVKFDLADALFRKGQYQQALDTALSVSGAGQKDDAYLALLADVYSHLGDAAKASQIFADAIHRNPDNDQYYLSLSLVQLRAGNLSAAESTLHKGLQRIPGSGKILWGLGVASAVRGDSEQASENLRRAVDLLPEWPGSYSTLGVLYYQTGQYEKAREVLERFKGSHAAGLDTDRIEQALANAPQTSAASAQPLSDAGRRQFLQMALSLADRTL